MTDRAQIKNIINHMDELSGRLSEFRGRFVKSQVAFERAKQDLSNLTRQKTIELSMLPHLQNATDPKTGKTNKEFSEFLLDEEMRHDPAFQQQIVIFYNSQEAWFEAQNDVLDVAEQLSVLKSQARLLASLMMLEAEDADLAETLGGND